MAKKGTHLSEETKEKIRKKLLGRRCCMASEFKKGAKPWNFGTKGIMKANSGTFKKGNLPANYMGGIKACKDGLYIRVGKKTKSYKYNNIDTKVGVYEQLARHKYRKAFGKFPKNMIILHKDGDMLNNEIENLELISRAELLKRNQYHTKKNCNICGKEFMARTNYAKTCSKKCYKENCKLLNKKWVNKNIEKNRAYKAKYRRRKRESKYL